MSDENVSYEAVLADLRAKRDRLDSAIRAIEELMGVATDITPAAAARAAVELGTVQEDTFLGMSTPAAAEKYLRMVKRPKETGEIAEALQKGGIHSTADNFTNSVYTALMRNEKVIRLGRGKWSLREWHPGA
jgi:hypothetical protein